MMFKCLKAFLSSDRIRIRILLNAFRTALPLVMMKCLLYKPNWRHLFLCFSLDPASSQTLYSNEVRNDSFPHILFSSVTSIQLSELPSIWEQKQVKRYTPGKMNKEYSWMAILHPKLLSVLVNAQALTYVSISQYIVTATTQTFERQNCRSVL